MVWRCLKRINQANHSGDADHCTTFERWPSRVTQGVGGCIMIHDHYPHMFAASIANNYPMFIPINSQPPWNPIFNPHDLLIQSAFLTDDYGIKPPFIWDFMGFHGISWDFMGFPIFHPSFRSWTFLVLPGITTPESTPCCRSGAKSMRSSRPMASAARPRPSCWSPGRPRKVRRTKGGTPPKRSIEIELSRML